MAERITEEQKSKAIEAYAEFGTEAKAAEIAGCCAKTLQREMKRSSKFNKAMLEARQIGYRHIGDQAVSNIRACALGEMDMDKTRLTANIALANAYADGFRRKDDTKVDVDIKIISGLPRPPAIKISKSTDSTPLLLENKDNI